jgi:GH15 family glucan-1,4-alpha-glucosidase
MGLDYGIIGNCKTAALISREGSIDWCCFPRFDSPSVFAKLLDEEKGGHFSLTPVHAYTASQSYVAETNVLKTSFTCRDGTFSVIDFFCRYRKKGKLMRDNKIYRLIEVHSGKPQVMVGFSPRLDYARGKTAFKHERGHIVARHARGFLSLCSSFDEQEILEGKPVTLTDDSYFIVGLGEHVSQTGLPYIKRNLRLTLAYWQDFVDRATWPTLQRDAAIRSALALKLLTYDRSGAIVAAATTSLPEVVGSSRTYDYRYCWLRDSSFTINAFTRICHFDEAQDYMRFLRKVALPLLKGSDMADLHIMYGVEGERDLRERTLNHLAGYMHSKPVRIGNSAYKQSQIDVPGEVIDTIHKFYVHYTYVKKLDAAAWKLVRRLVAYVIRHWRDTDQGIWEFRGKKKHFTHSKLMCWVALEKAIELGLFFKKKAPFDDWKRHRDEIKESILKKAWSVRKKAFTMSYGSESLDASVLLMPYYGFLDAKDKRMKSTIDAIEKELCKKGLVMRYTIKDDFGKPVNSFSVCTFWFIDALYRSGQKKKAERYFNSVIQYSNHLGLFSEDIDLATGELVGNFPQAYTHLSLLTTAILLSGQGARRPVCLPRIKT